MQLMAKMARTAGSGEGRVVGMFVVRTAIEDGIVGGTGEAGGLVTDGIFPLTRVNTKLPQTSLNVVDRRSTRYSSCLNSFVSRVKDQLLFLEFPETTRAVPDALLGFPNRGPPGLKEPVIT